MKVESNNNLRVIFVEWTLICILMIIVVLYTGCSNEQLELHNKSEFSSNTAETNMDDDIIKSVSIEVSLEPTLNYYHIGTFSEGLAVATIHSNDFIKPSGYINEKGEEVISPKYYQASEFSEGFAVVQLDSTYKTFIDKDENQLIKPVIGYLGSFNDGLAVVLDNGTFHGYVDTQGNKVITLASSDNVSLKVNIVGRTFQEGLAVVYNKETKKYGYIDKTGDLVIPFEYDRANSFQEGVAVVMKDDAYYTINKKGVKIIDLSKLPDIPNSHLDERNLFDAEQHMFSEGLLHVNKEIENYYMDKNGKIMLNDLGSYVEPFYSGRARIYRYDKDVQDMTFAFIDKRGKLVTDFIFKVFGYSSFSEGVAFQKKIDGEGIYINQAGDEIFSCYWGDCFKGGYAPFQYEYDGQWGILKLLTD